ncbi:MAG: CHASE2 domain-containing protein [Candidatus Thiodiazotropha sp. (ex Lucinoma borealis)]|nr:CHASE2 domain-containing protein [Candidatus Thiodiazotropha sp. (ex Lucinoma borealis)]MCU7838782.1 CHASE2 domain-containing protein [Candidatus Thiodiazotropha sp. (ex Troendleina suluensis)]MCU7865788.1 CHASE2 domain-containing protein [Candidatus Thiodiazotropha sp. (ex Lucinoma borealis)]MCU7870302.1 CHASE2 domain-containing protein [Candidatus Thiodiazotropha sp. (ex Lucinoma borealis)]
MTHWISAKYRALLVALAIGVAVWSLSQFGLFSVPSGLLYDWLVGFSASRHYQPNVVLVGIPTDKKLSGSDWLRLFQTLEHFGAAQLVVFPPDESDEDFFTAASQSPNLVLGRHLVGDPIDPEKQRLEPWPKGGEGLAYGVVTLPLTEQGNYRRSPVSQTIEGERVEPMTWVAARLQGIELPLLSERGYLINFNQGRYSLPTIRFDRLMAGNLIEELIAGRSILIGNLPALSAPGLRTPVTTRLTPMSTLEFHGYALDSLLGDRVITELDSRIALFWIVTVVLASVFIYQWIRIRESMWITGSALIIYTLLGWATLWLLWIWIPVLELATAQTVMFFWITHEKSSRMEREMSTMLAEMSTRLRKSALPPRFYDTPHHWEQLVAMVDQTLSLTRLIFLERVEADHRVKEIQALRCSMDVIDERRRDYERTPYSTAIATGGPIRLEGNYLIKSDLESEDQYLVPLIYSGEILGFWAFGVDMAKTPSRQQMENIAKDFSYQIAELLYHRRHWQNKEAEEARILNQYLSLQGGEVVHRDVHQALELMERRLSVQQSVFDGLDTATVLYDLFGRVMQINHHLEQLMSEADIPAFDYTALDLLTALTTLEREACQDLLRQVIMERRSLSIPAQLEVFPDRRFLLKIRALSHDESNVDSVIESTPFELLGVLFEMDDVSPVYRLYRHKEKLIRHLGKRIGHSLDGLLDMSAENAAAMQSPSLDRISARIQDESRMLREATTFLNKDVGALSLQLFPVDGRQPILENIEASKGRAEISDIAIVAELPDSLSLVMADPEQLHAVTASVLDALIKDATEESTIRIVVEEGENWIRYGFRNQGFGMPNDRFQEYLFEDDGATEDYSRLRSAVHHVQSWGGTVEATSELGVGTHIEIKLRAFG